jgi:hypothetical protein
VEAKGHGILFLSMYIPIFPEKLSQTINAILRIVGLGTANLPNLLNMEGYNYTTIAFGLWMWDLNKWYKTY